MKEQMQEEWQRESNYAPPLCLLRRHLELYPRVKHGRFRIGPLRCVETVDVSPMMFGVVEDDGLA